MQQREKILALKAEALRVQGAVKFTALAAQTDGWSGAEITALVQEAGLVGLKRSIGQGVSADEATVGQEDFLSAFESIKEKRAQHSF